ncbi:hypothetical protein GEOBRER4_n1899 [Citrifermentans bremense]|jgi:hypothetical protein|uniref:Uncharacterized protein n=2 Tax=Geobacteraceae TaxID=213422 RepID=A0A6S6M579_9BACT|nr:MULTISPECIES: hypothetical protein [Geobacteraceae]TGU70709.1 hypothetical protein E4633_17065 [Geomonas terrae]BCG47076.1 hypothetical protein GEOBRER4_n1899 [Citrifermentans bremense]
MNQQQTQKRSGSQYHLNLDPLTYAALCGCKQAYHKHGQDFSNSVIVRRALRAHLEQLEVMSPQAIGQDIIKAKRAAKGVL